jgi:hypothetical protein
MLTHTSVESGRHRSRLGRRLAWLGVLAFALCALAVAPGAMAQPQEPGPPGNNGTVKIHEGMDHSDPPKTDRNNQPHVCDFHIHGFNFDSAESGVWRIYDWPPTGDRSLVASDDWTADSDGEWMSELFSGWEDGHYRLAWEIPGDGNDDKDGDWTADKHKMFWIECEESGEIPVEATPTATATATSTATGGELGATATPTSPAGTPGGGELPAGATPAQPTGAELPGGEVPGVTPPETAAADPAGSGGRAPMGLVLLVLGVGLAGLVLLTPVPRRSRR